MASETEIANSSLISLGAATILDINDDTKTAKLCKRRLPELRDKLLRTYSWSFAIARKELSQIATAPAYGYSYAHQLPSDYIRLIEIDLRSTEYKREEDTIVSNNSEVFIRYVKRITDPNKMDVAFRASLSALIAKEICLAITDNQNLYKIMKVDYLDTISEARNASAIEQGAEAILAEEWLRSRFTGTSGPEGFYRE